MMKKVLNRDEIFLSYKSDVYDSSDSDDLTNVFLAHNLEGKQL